MSDIKAIFFDLDGTLVDKKTEDIPLSTQAALRALREKGIKLFICSGRPPMWADLIRKKFDFRFDGKVLLNGQYCVDADGVPFYKNPLTRKQLENIIRWLERNPQVVCTFMEADYAYNNLPGYSKTRPVEPVRRCLEHPTYQVSPQGGPEMDEAILAQVPGVKSARWNDTSTDLIPGSGGKPVGMRKMLDRFGLKREECMAFGDGANDVEMLRFAGTGVAMGNGDSKAKQAVYYLVGAAGVITLANYFAAL